MPDSLPIAIIYASHDGQTQRIAERLQQHLNDLGHQTTLINVEQRGFDLSAYRYLVLGAAIRYGKHLKPMVNFINTYETQLSQHQAAFFSVNLTARKENRNTPETSRYLQKYLKKLTWQPDLLAVFAGRLNYSMYRFFDKTMIRFIMWMTKGPTDPSTVIEYTDWDKVKDFAENIHQQVLIK